MNPGPDDDESTGVTEDAHVEEANGAEEPEGSSRGWRIAAVVAVLAALGSLGVLGYVLFAGGSSGPKGDVRACIIDVSSRDFRDDGAHERPSGCPPEGSVKSDGLVQKTSEGGFTMREIVNGTLGETVTLHVREPDRPYIDIAHAQTHAALGQPIRVYTLEIGGRESVVYMEDAPLLR